MKKFALFVLCLLIFSGCKKEEPKPDHRIQDYTSFIFWHRTPNITFYNCVVGYFTPDGLCHKIAELGDLKPNKMSKEVKVDKVYAEIFLFTEYYGVIKIKTAYKLRENYRNLFEIDEDVSVVGVSKNNPYEYPH